jgi:N-acetylglucosamine kinase
LGGRLIGGHANIGGEFGHAPLPADLILKHDLPVVACGCGRNGCVETLVSGPGLTRIADRITGRPMTPIEIVDARQTDEAVAQVWAIWCALVAETMMLLVTTVDPELIVLGGGLSNIPDVTTDLTLALRSAQISGFAVPRIERAQGGDASGARGAAIAAWQENGQ